MAAGAPAWEGAPPNETRDRPPRGRTRAPSNGKGKATGNKPAPSFDITIPQLREKVLDQFAKLGTMLSAVEPYDAEVLLDGAERWTDSLMELCKTKPWLRKRVENAVSGGIYLEFVFATACIAIPIGKHHNVLPDSIPDPNAILGKFGQNYSSPNGHAPNASENSSIV